MGGKMPKRRYSDTPPKKQTAGSPENHLFAQVKTSIFVEHQDVLLMAEIGLSSWYGKHPIIYRVLYIPGGAGFLPSKETSLGILRIFIQKSKEGPETWTWSVQTFWEPGTLRFTMGMIWIFSCPISVPHVWNTNIHPSSQKRTCIKTTFDVSHSFQYGRIYTLLKQRLVEFVSLRNNRHTTYRLHCVWTCSLVGSTCPKRLPLSLRWYLHFSLPGMFKNSWKKHMVNDRIHLTDPFLQRFQYD